MAHEISVLTGDVINSSTLPRGELDLALAVLAAAADQIGDWPDCDQTRFTRSGGDGWQIYLTNQKFDLRAALFLRAALQNHNKKTRTRISVATGDGFVPDDADLNAAHGSAFSASGRGLKHMSRKATMEHASGGALAATFRLADHISQSWTAVQARAMGFVLPPQSLSRTEAAKAIGTSRQAVGQALKGAGYIAIKEALALIELEKPKPDL